MRVISSVFTIGAYISTVGPSSSSRPGSNPSDAVRDILMQPIFNLQSYVADQNAPQDLRAGAISVLNHLVLNPFLRHVQEQVKTFGCIPSSPDGLAKYEVLQKYAEYSENKQHLDRIEMALRMFRNAISGGLFSEWFIADDAVPDMEQRVLNFKYIIDLIYSSEVFGFYQRQIDAIYIGVTRKCIEVIKAEAVSILEYRILVQMLGIVMES